MLGIGYVLADGIGPTAKMRDLIEMVCGRRHNSATRMSGKLFNKGPRNLKWRRRIVNALIRDYANKAYGD